MVGERQTEAHQAGPPPIEEDAAYWRKMYEERLTLQEDGFTALLVDRDDARAERDEWRRKAQTFEGDASGQAAQNRSLRLQVRHAEARAESQAAEIVALLRSYANVHMTQALADLIEHKYGAGYCDKPTAR